MEKGIVKKTVDWIRQADRMIIKAGGHPHLIGKFPDDLLETLVRNDLYLVYLPVDNTE